MCLSTQLIPEVVRGRSEKVKVALWVRETCCAPLTWSRVLTPWVMVMFLTRPARH